MWTKTKDKLPPEYKDVIVIHGGQRKIMKHEAGWWYGCDENDPPHLWLDDDSVNSALKQAGPLINEVGLCTARRKEEALKSQPAKET